MGPVVRIDLRSSICRSQKNVKEARPEQVRLLYLTNVTLPPISLVLHVSAVNFIRQLTHHMQTEHYQVAAVNHVRA